METKSFRPQRQVPVFRKLANQGLITNLKLQKTSVAACVWEFNLSADLTIQFDDGRSISMGNLSNYRFRVTYSRRTEPRVYIIAPVLKRRIHTWEQDDGRLCLYRPDLWSWRDNMQFDQELFPQVALWTYYYELWLETGTWYGEEAPHPRKFRATPRYVG